MAEGNLGNEGIISSLFLPSQPTSVHLKQGFVSADLLDFLVLNKLRRFKTYFIDLLSKTSFLPFTTK